MCRLLFEDRQRVGGVDSPMVYSKESKICQDYYQVTEGKGDRIGTSERWKVRRLERLRAEERSFTRRLVQDDYPRRIVILGGIPEAQGRRRGSTPPADHSARRSARRVPRPAPRAGRVARSRSP